jgi:O-antigen/teichoic acid export membrane protein
MVVLKNTFFLLTGQSLGKLMIFILFVFLARSLSVETFGQFNFIFAYAAIFGVLMDFGMDILVPKLVAKTPFKLNFLFSLFKFKLISTGIVFTIYVVITIGLSSNSSFSAFLLAGLAAALYSLLSFIFGIFRGKEDLVYEAIFTIVHKAIFLSLAVFLIYFGVSLAAVFGALLFATLIVFTLAILTTWKKYRNLANQRGRAESKNNAVILKEALPFLFINVCTVIYFRIDTLMLAFLKSDYEVGIYNAAYRLLEGLIFIPGAFMTAFFPVLIRAGNSKKNFLETKFKEGLISLSIIGLIISGILIAGSNLFISLLWGARYVEAVPILKLLAVALMIIHFNYLVTQSAIAQNQEKFYMITVVCAVFMNIGLNFPLINIYGAKGAAISTILTELFIGSAIYFKILCINKNTFSEIELI